MLEAEIIAKNESQTQNNQLLDKLEAIEQELKDTEEQFEPLYAQNQAY